jgi:uncharacterized membrane protein SirB2
MYIWLKTFHVCFAIISVTGFVARGVLAIRSSPLLRQRWVRKVIDTNDTLLLAAGIALSVVSAQYPFAQSWLTAKLAGVVVYIALGILALRPTLRPAWRLACGIAALVVVAYIIGVAITKNPLL